MLCVGLYTACGCVSSGLVGAILGILGSLFRLRHILPGLLWAVAGLASLMAAREFGVVQFYCPEPKRQTHKLWANEFGFPWASAMWGFHIGASFATRMTFGGFWILVLMAMLWGSAPSAAALMLSYWIGRCGSLWLAPVMIQDGCDAKPSELVSADAPRFHRVAGYGLLWSAVVVMLFAVTG